MRVRLLFVVLLLLPLLTAGQKVEPTWESLNRRGYPQWFSDAKLGIFIHWGLYSVPAYASKEGYAEWFYRGLMTGDAGRRRIMSLYADTTLPVFEQYKTLAGHWHGELWQPDEWARLFRDAGARYVMLVTKHHDGYCLWDSPQQPEWNSTVSGPHRNIVAELTEAVRREGLRMGFYYSLPEWSNPRHIWMQDADDSIADYVDNYMIPQFKELVERYRPDAIFADGDWQNTAGQFHAEELISWYYNTVGPDAIVNNRWGNGTQHGFKTPEYSAGLAWEPTPWAECRGIGRSFGYNRNEDIDNYLSERELIQHFVELVSNGGGLTLNVGPMADGTIPPIQQERLRALGRWLQVNGEAIYGAHPYFVTGCMSQVVGVHNQYARTVAELPVSSTIDFDWVRNAPIKGMPVDNFTIHWHGVFDAPKKGWYSFKAVADDEMTVTLDGDTILYYNHSWAENKPSATVLLKQNQSCELDVWYREKDLESSAALLVSNDGEHFVPAAGEWHGTAEWQQTVRCFTRKGDDLYVFEFERPIGSLAIPGLRRLPKEATIEMLGTSAALRWKQSSKGVLTIDLTAVDQDEMRRLDNVWVIKIKNYFAKL